MSKKYLKKKKRRLGRENPKMKSSENVFFTYKGNTFSHFFLILVSFFTYKTSHQSSKRIERRWSSSKQKTFCYPPKQTNCSKLFIILSFSKSRQMKPKHAHAN